MTDHRPCELVQSDTGAVLQSWPDAFTALEAVAAMPDATKRGAFLRLQPMSYAEAEKAALAKLRAEYAV
jgi:hypothetical protein